MSKWQGDPSPVKVREFKVVREKSGKMEKAREKSGEVKSGVRFQALNTPKLVFRPGLCPGPFWGAP